MTIDKALISIGLSIHTAPKNISHRKKPNYGINDEDTKEMIKLRERNAPYKEIGKHFGISDQLVYTRIKRYKEKLKKQLA